MKVYLDNNATSAVAAEVLEAMLPYFSAEYGNPSRPHGFGREARKAIGDAREVVAKALNASATEIVFTGSGTEADNLGLLGTACASARVRRFASAGAPANS
jgi:cysteine desulfurase